MGGKLSKWTKSDAANGVSAKVRRGKSDVGHTQPRKSPKKVNKSADQPGTPVEDENANVTLNTADLLQAASNSDALKDVINNIKEEEVKVSDSLQQETNKILENTSTAIDKIKESENVQKITDVVNEGAEKVESVVETAVSKVNDITGGTNELSADKSFEKEKAPEVSEVSSDVQMSVNMEQNITNVIDNGVKEEKNEALIELNKEVTEPADSAKLGITLPSVNNGLSTFKSSANDALESISTSAENAKTTAENFLNDTIEGTKTSVMDVANNVIDSVPFLEKSEDKATENTPEAKNELANVSGEIEKPIDTEVKVEHEVEQAEVENLNKGQFSMPTIDNNFIQENIQSLNEKGKEIIESGEEKINNAIENAEKTINDKTEQLFGTTVFSTETDKVNEEKSEASIEDTKTESDSKPDQLKIEEASHTVPITDMGSIEERHESKNEENLPSMDQKVSEQLDTFGSIKTEDITSQGEMETSQIKDEISMPEAKDAIDVKSESFSESKADHVDEISSVKVDTSITPSEELSASQLVSELKSDNIDEVKLEQDNEIESHVADEQNASSLSEQNNEIKSDHKETAGESCDISIKESISSNLNIETVDANQSTENIIPKELVNSSENVHELPDNEVDEKASEIVDTAIGQAKDEIGQSFESNELPAPPESKPTCVEENILERQQSDIVIDSMDDKRISEISLPDPPVMTNNTLSNGFDGSEGLHTPEINKPSDELLNKIVDSESTIKVCPKADLEEKLNKYLKTKNLVEDSVEADRLIKQFLDTLDISDLETSVNRCTTQLFEEIKHGEITEDSQTDLVSLLLKTSS